MCNEPKKRYSNLSDDVRLWQFSEILILIYDIFYIENTFTHTHTHKNIRKKMKIEKKSLKKKEKHNQMYKQKIKNKIKKHICYLIFAHLSSSPNVLNLFNKLHYVFLITKHTPVISIKKKKLKKKINKREKWC